MLRSALLALSLSALALMGQPAQAQTTGATLSVELTELAPQGAVMMQLFDSEASYSAGQGVAARRIPVSAATANAAFEGLAPGQYAIRLFHDVNGDGELNTNPFGIPTEPFAFSNNARSRFGPAAWDAAMFTVTAGANVQQISVGGR